MNQSQKNLKSKNIYSLKRHLTTWKQDTEWLKKYCVRLWVQSSVLGRKATTLMWGQLRPLQAEVTLCRHWDTKMK